jgi:uncharacterized membrane protein
MRMLTRSFAQGLLVLAPVAITVGIVWWLVTTLDKWMGASVPGFGLVIAVAAITLIGYLTGNVVGRRLVALIESALQRVPIVKLLYNSLRDLFGAFVGNRRKFDQPVLVEVNPHGMKVLGFITCQRFDDPQLQDHVAVYLPESYNFAGNLVVVPRERVQALDADGAQFMAFIMSGGVTEMGASRTVVEQSAKLPA